MKENIYRGFLIPHEVGFSGAGRYFLIESHSKWFELFGREYGLACLIPRKYLGREVKPSIVDRINEVFPVYTQSVSCQDAEPLETKQPWVGQYPYYPGEHILMVWAENWHDARIGSLAHAWYLIGKGITKQVQPSNPGSKQCAVGFDGAQWWGWSHRAMSSYSVGSRVNNGDIGYALGRGEWTAQTLDDAKTMAVNFAQEVG